MVSHGWSPPAAAWICAAILLNSPPAELKSSISDSREWLNLQKRHWHSMKRIAAAWEYFPFTTTSVKCYLKKQSVQSVHAKRATLIPAGWRDLTRHRWCACPALMIFMTICFHLLRRHKREMREWTANNTQFKRSTKTFAHQTELLHWVQLSMLPGFVSLFK